MVKTVIAAATPALSDWSVLDEAAPPADPGQASHLDARGALSGELATATAADSLAQSGHTATATTGDGDGVSPLTVVLLTLIISSGAFGLLMVSGKEATIERR